MGALLSSGYQAAAQAIAWTSGQSLHSLTNNEWTDLSDEIDNTTNKYLSADIEIYLGSAAFTGYASAIEVYIVPSVDGTNYPTWTGNATTEYPHNKQYGVASLLTTQTTATNRLAARDVALPPGKFKFGFRNVSGPTLASSGNTAKWRPHSVEWGA